MTDDEEYQKFQRQKELAEQRGLKLYNGRGFDMLVNDVRVKYDHLFVAAKSQKQAIELCKKAGYELMTPYEFRLYWHKNAWGRIMLDIEPEAGVWATLGPSWSSEKPVRLA